MRKVTASAVILTALTGCGQSSGIPSTQWSFEVPPEDKIGSAHLGDSFSDADSDADSALDLAAQPWNADAADSGMMGPAFFQPESGGLGGGLSVAGRPGGKELSGAGSEDYSSLLSTRSSHQSVSARPDPVAQVKAFLSANRGPSSLTNRAPFSSQVLLPSMPTVGTPMPTSAIASTLGDPTDMEARAVPSGSSTTFASTSLPTIGFSNGGGAYSSVGETETYTASSSRSSVTDSAITGTVSAERSSELPQPAATTEEGLPILAPIQDTEIESRLPASEARTQQPAEDISIGTAILRDIQGTESIPSAQSQPVAQAQPAEGFISIDVVPATDVVPAATSSPEQLAAQPTLESLRRSMIVRETPPIVTEARMNAATRAELSQANLPEAPELADSYPQASDPEIAISALSQPVQPETAVSNTSIRSDSPTLESLLETMPENAAEPNFEATSLDGQSASPLLEGLRSATPLSTLYMPIPPEVAAEVTLTDATESALQRVNQSAKDMLVSEASAPSDAVALMGEEILRNALTSMLAPNGNLRNAAGQLMSQEDARLKGAEGVADLVKRRGDRNGAILSLVDKRSAKRRQLVTWQ